MVCVQLLHYSLPFIYQMTMCRYCLLVLWISMLSGCCVGGIYVYLFPLRLETMFCLEPTSSSCTLLSTGLGPTTGETGVQCRRPLIADIRWKQKAMICWCLSVGLSVTLFFFFASASTCLQQYYTLPTYQHRNKDLRTVCLCIDVTVPTLLLLHLLILTV